MGRTKGGPLILLAYNPGPDSQKGDVMRSRVSHWKISRSSPASPARAMLKFFGLS